MTNRQNAARAVGAGACAPVSKLRVAANDNQPTKKKAVQYDGFVPNGYYRSKVHPTLCFPKREDAAAALVSHEVPVEEWKVSPISAGERAFTAELKRTVSKLIKAGKVKEAFKKRQSIGEDWYKEQERLSGSYGIDNYAVPEFRRDIDWVVLNKRAAA